MEKSQNQKNMRKDVFFDLELLKDDFMFFEESQIETIKTIPGGTDEYQQSTFVFVLLR